MGCATILGMKRVREYCPPLLQRDVGGSVGLIQHNLHNTIVLNTNGESASDCLNKKTILFDLMGLLSGCLISVLKRV